MYKKKTVVIIFLLLTTSFFVSMVQADDIVTTLDYQETEIVTLPGEHDLIYNDSDTGTQDVQILWSIYNNQSNITVVCISSQEISYDSGFSNDTKAYFYNDRLSENVFLILVNYSSIDVPLSFDELLNKTISDKDLIIADLNWQIEILQSEKTTLNVTVQNQIKQLEKKQKSIDETIDKWNAEKAKNYPLHVELYNLTKEIEQFENDTAWLSYNVSMLLRDKQSRDSTIEQMQNPWSLGYIYRGKEYGYFNIACFFIGIVIATVGLFLFFKWKNDHNVFHEWKSKALRKTSKSEELQEFETLPDFQDHPNSILDKMKKFEDKKIEKQDIEDPFNGKTNAILPEKIITTDDDNNGNTKKPVDVEKMYKDIDELVDLNDMPEVR